MADASKDTDQSMEDILQSIKRIIADEGDTGAAVGGSDVLELTELLAEDVAVPAPAAEAPPPPPPLPPAPAASAQDAIDALFDAAPVAPEPTPEPVPEPLVEAPPVAVAPVAVTAPPPALASLDGEKLMSDATLAASAAALHALAHTPTPIASQASPVFRNGTTVEDLVLETLKPMLKEWLDGNLPAMVRQLVEREVRRLSGQI